MRLLARLAEPGQWARMHDMHMNAPAISHTNPCGCAAFFCYLKIFACMKEITLAYLVSNYSRIMAPYHSYIHCALVGTSYRQLR